MKYGQAMMCQKMGAIETADVDWEFDGYILNINIKGKMTLGPIETTRGKIRVYKSLDSVVSTIKRLGIKNFQVNL